MISEERPQAAKSFLRLRFSKRRRPREPLIPCRPHAICGAFLRGGQGLAPAISQPQRQAKQLRSRIAKQVAVGWPQGSREERIALYLAQIARWFQWATPRRSGR